MKNIIRNMEKKHQKLVNNQLISEKLKVLLRNYLND